MLLEILIITCGPVIGPGVGIQPSLYPTSALYAYGGPLSTQQQTTVIAAAENAVLPVSSGHTAHQQQQRYNSIPAAQSPSAFATAYQPIVYWYPSPPMSPQNAFYLSSFPATAVFMKGPSQPNAASAQDVVRYLEGVNEVNLLL